ncbi:MAG: hypothetical protein OXM01_14660 [Gemmatimonadota bacterium]|nr:hypothetical protein [Gemmatimonadota bacterium]
MRSFHSMKYQILAAAALLLSGPYIAAAANHSAEGATLSSPNAATRCPSRWT